MGASLEVRLSLAATLFISLKLGFGEEICLNEIVGVSCSEEESLFIESAIIGRLNDSRCYILKDSEQECRSDIRKPVQKLSRNTNGLRIPSGDNFFASRSPRPCLRGSEYSLEIKHRCLKEERYEVCMGKEFKVECEGSIEIQSAVFGRMRSSKCIDFDVQNLICAQDVKMFFKSLCDKRKNCSVFIEPGMFNSSSCDRSLEQYLEVSHTCLNTSTVSENSDWTTVETAILIFGSIIVFLLVAALSAVVIRCKDKNSEVIVDDAEMTNTIPTSKLTTEAIAAAKTAASVASANKTLPAIEVQSTEEYSALCGANSPPDQSFYTKLEGKKDLTKIQSADEYLTPDGFRSPSAAPIYIEVVDLDSYSDAKAHEDRLYSTRDGEYEDVSKMNLD